MVTQQEAQAIAHLARTQVGATAQVQRDGETWVVLARVGDSVERIANGADYTAWRDRVLPSAGDRERRQGRIRSVLGAVGWLVGGLTAVLAQAVVAVFNQDKREDDTKRDLTTAYLEEIERGYGYRRTHPPGRR